MRAVDLYSRRLVQSYKISTPQLICLLALQEYGSMNVHALANHVHLSASTVVGILDRLEDKCLITRAREKTDRRRVLVSLTDRGIALTEEAPSPLQDVLANGLKQLPEDEQITIAKALERVVVMMEAEHIDASPVLQTGSFKN